MCTSPQSSGPLRVGCFPSSTASKKGSQPAASMREYVSTLIRSELKTPSGARVPSQTFLLVFQQLSSAPRRLRSEPGEEAAVADLIASELLQQQQQGRGDAAGALLLDRHLRFQGLRKRLLQLRKDQLGQRWPELRCAVLQLLFLLRGEATNAVAAPPLPRAPSRVLPQQLVAPALPTPTAAQNEPSELAAAFVPHLGWYVAGATSTAPCSISEGNVIRDVLHALQGVNSACFRYSEKERRFIVSQSFVFSRPTWSLVQRMLELGSLHSRLCQATKAARERLVFSGEKSLLHQALCEAIYEQLQDYSKLLVMLVLKSDSSCHESRSSSAASGGKNVPEVTLRRLWAWLLVPLHRMRLLVTLSDACVPLRGGALASAVHGFSQVGDSSAQEACKVVLQKVVRPLLAMIKAWMTEGELQDPYGEFFVCADASVPLEHLWTSMYYLEVEMVPRFVTMELARKILLTGKSVNFIRLCCPGQGWLQATAPTAKHGRSDDSASFSSRADSRMLTLAQQGAAQEQTLQPAEARARKTAASGDWLLEDLASRVEFTARQANRHLVSLLMEHYALQEHCLALRRFMLLGQGDFVEALMDTAAPELSRSAADVQRHQLMGIVDMAVRQSNAQFCAPDVVARLGVKLLAPSAGERGWDIFLLDYAIDSPLHVVFTAAAMQQYDRAFAFLWKLRRVSHALASCWSHHMTLQRQIVSFGRPLAREAPELGLEMRQTLHRCTCLRNEMQHFVQNVCSHIMCEVLETSWAKLQEGWRSCADLDELILEHQRYLARIEEGAFLTPKAEAIFTHLSALFSLALDFTELHEQVCLSVSDAVELLLRQDEAAAALAPIARSLATCRAQLDQIGAGFLVRLQALLRALETQPTLRHLSADLRFLLCRLDFNAYYETRRAAAVADRLYA